MDLYWQLTVQSTFNFVIKPCIPVCFVTFNSTLFKSHHRDLMCNGMVLFQEIVFEDVIPIPSKCVSGVKMVASINLDKQNWLLVSIHLPEDSNIAF